MGVKRFLSPRFARCLCSMRKCGSCSCSTMKRNRSVPGRSPIGGTWDSVSRTRENQWILFLGGRCVGVSFDDYLDFRLFFQSEGISVFIFQSVFYPNFFVEFF